MKKFCLVMAMALMSVASVKAQGGQMNEEDRARMREEMVKRQTEALVKDLKLSGDEKTAFEELYAKYQGELMETFQFQRRDRDSEGERKKLSEMSDEEITARIQEAFDRQEKQIEQQKARLEIQKKYYAEFAKTLKPNQLIRIFGQQRQQGQRGEGQRGDGQRGQGQRGGFQGGRGGGFGGPGGPFGGPF